MKIGKKKLKFWKIMEIRGVCVQEKEAAATVLCSVERVDGMEKVT